MLGALLSIPECARLAGISVRRMRTLIEAGRKQDPTLVQGSERRPLIQREALGRIIGHNVALERRMDDLEGRMVYVERALELR